MTKEWDACFEHAEATLKKIGTLLAWRELELSEERPGCDAMRLIHRSTTDDLKAQVGAFMNAFFTLYEQLQARSRTIRARQTRRLQKLWGRFHALELHLAKAL